jgi:hypothetical protein
MTPDKKVSVIHEGEIPLIGKVLQDDSGNYFCTTAFGGSYKKGAIIKFH